MTGTRLRDLRGRARVEITGACPEDCLSLMTKRQVVFRDYEKVDQLTVRFSIPVNQLRTLESCGKRTMCSVKVMSVRGMIPALRSMGGRVLFLLLLLGLTVVVFIMQKHIWFFTVEGNVTISQEEILRILEEEGVGFWTGQDEINMEQLENRVLSRIPELGYLTINHHGGIAAVVVREREERPGNLESAAPANILAKKSGIILALTPAAGTPQVSPGTVVGEGDLLISGVTDLDKTMILSRARGEVYARTFTDKTVCLEENCMEKSYTGRETRKLSVTFGKNTINFFKTSGISYDNYDKMMVMKTITLPGGYDLPLTFTVVTFREYHPVKQSISQPEAEELMHRSLRKQLETELVAGEIEDLNMTLTNPGGLFSLKGICQCREEISNVVEIKE